MANAKVGQSPLPQVTRTYQNHHLDSTRWQFYVPRPDDIIISTAYKAGTTWTQMIVSLLIFQDEPIPTGLGDLSPWIDARMRPLEQMYQELEAQTHRRSLKSHLPLDAQPYYEQVKYIIVGRDGRDVFMSLRNHFRRYTPEFRELINNLPDRVGGPVPDFEEDIRVMWRDWLTKAAFSWEKDGWPHWSFFHHIQTWWDFRHLDNFLFVHYSDLLANLEREMRRIADYLDIRVTESLWPKLVEQATFDSMKKNADALMPRASFAFQGGGEAFIYKGVNGRWRDELTDADLRLYDETVAARLTADCAKWVEQGGPVA